jgi:hypothetical protein
MTPAQHKLLREIASGECRTCHEDYKPARALERLELVVRIPQKFGQVKLALTAKGRETGMLRFNLPLQLHRMSSGATRYLNYMPRRDAVAWDEDLLTPLFLSEASKTLRNLADLIDAYAAGKIDCVYYPDQENLLDKPRASD